MITANVDSKENFRMTCQAKGSLETLIHAIESIPATLVPYIPSIRKREAILENGFPLIP